MKLLISTGKSTVDLPVGINNFSICSNWNTDQKETAALFSSMHTLVTNGFSLENNSRLTSD